ncbi:MAG: Aklanonic acid methyl ester cyclase DnrD [Acidimicrobiales bacterium]|nr:MAG: DUF4440 domain-containing protein [Actinomycetota bacterium]MBV6509361.1 Aklanonic acid methyl ester cyclase DnrD [Acidimicrobiales bacterium]RIK04604.1 MAG: ketosteroid isomerase [Acidobacteriota bacterium]
MANAAELHRQMLDAVLDRDFDKLRDLCHADYVYAGGDGVEQKGADAGVAVAETYSTAFPDLSFEIRSQYEFDGDVSVLELTARGTHEAELEGIPPTGRRVEVVVCNIIEIQDGKIYREREYFDGLSLMQQLGVIEG